MTGSFEVAKYGSSVLLADGTCRCGQPIKCNLRAGYVGHTDPAVNAACAEPWPDVPNPAAYEVARRYAEVTTRVFAGRPTESAPALGLEPHHRRGKERTDGEAAVLEPKYATGGFVESGVNGDNPPPWLTTCAYDGGGFLPSGLEAWRNDTGRAITLDGKEPLPSGLTRVKLSDGRVDVPAGTEQYFGDEFFDQVNAVRPPSGGACCQAAYDSDGFAHDHEVAR